VVDADWEWIVGHSDVWAPSRYRYLDFRRHVYARQSPVSHTGRDEGSAIGFILVINLFGLHGGKVPAALERLRSRRFLKASSSEMPAGQP
jgi:hypothetical protein